MSWSLIRGFLFCASDVDRAARGRASSRLGGGGGGVFAADRLDDQAVADGLGADLQPHDPPVDHGADLLDVRLELPRGDPGHLRADAAEVLRLAAVGDLLAEGGPLAGKVT